MAANKYRATIYSYVIYDGQGKTLGVVGSLKNAVKITEDNKSKGYKFDEFILNSLIK